jgi:myo-inositol-1(or 4)-monophosphatase
MESGGKVTNYEGAADFTQGNSVIASNTLIHTDLLEAIRN